MEAVSLNRSVRSSMDIKKWLAARVPSISAHAGLKVDANSLDLTYEVKEYGERSKKKILLAQLKSRVAWIKRDWKVHVRNISQ
jgi:hypothetical protein